MRVHKNILPVIYIVIIISIGLSGCRRNETSLSPPQEDMPDQVIEDFFLIETEGEEVVWKLTANRAEIYNDAHRAEITTVKVDFYEEGEYTSTLTSDTGEIDTITNDMVARGNVVVNSMKEGAVLKTDELMWQSHTGLIVSEYPVTMERGDGIIKGKGFTATPGLSEFKTTDMVAVLPEEDFEEYEEGDDESDK
ncbi:MAG: LPS export ABC transporter periplasmic protein LptC [bacterium]|nr:LPS export ABC transporter periplasmic protein LptC [bacterium]